MASITTNCRLHRTAIALNNVGVSFLHRGYYCNALDAFQKAFELMEDFNDAVEHEVEPDSPRTSQQSDDTNIDIEYLQVASQKLARSKYQKKEGEDEKFRIRVIELDREGDFEALHSLPMDSVGFAIRIEVFDQEFSYDSQKFQIDCAIMLLNLGIACYMYEASNKSVRHRPNKDAVYEKVLSICTGSFDILSSLYCGENDIYQARRVGLLSILVLQTLMATASKMDQQCQALDYFKQLVDIRREIASYEIINPCQGSGRTSSTSRCTYAAPQA